MKTVLNKTDKINQSGNYFESGAVLDMDKGLMALRGRIVFLPWNAPSLHLVGHSDVCRPHIILPALLPQHAPQHGPTVHPDPHVHVGLGLLTNIPVEDGSSSIHSRNSPHRHGRSRFSCDWDPSC